MGQAETGTVLESETRLKSQVFRPCQRRRVHLSDWVFACIHLNLRLIFLDEIRLARHPDYCSARCDSRHMVLLPLSCFGSRTQPGSARLPSSEKSQISTATVRLR